MADPMFVCADCGRTLLLKRGRWADERRPGLLMFACRDHFRTMPDGSQHIEAVDYHYVAGETQLHFDGSQASPNNEIGRLN